MKKIMIVLCAASIFLSVACSSDSDDGPSGPATVTGTSGTIASIDLDGSPYEVWNWTDSILTSVSNASTGQEKVRFGYNSSGRVNTITFGTLNLAGIPLSGTLKVLYNGDKIALLRMVRNDNTNIFVANITYDGDKMDSAIVDLDNSMILTLFNTLLPQILGGQGGVGENLPTIEDVSTNVDLEWTGNNVSSLMLAVDILASTTIGELSDLIGDFSILGPYGTLLSIIADTMPDLPVNFDITLADTTTFTYDNRKNPYQGYLGQIDVSTLSTNNVLTKNDTRAVHIVMSTNIGFPVEIPFSYPLSGDNVTYTYQKYNQGGYPVKVSSSNGETREFHYKEQ